MSKNEEAVKAMPRGWEHFNKDATEEQAVILLGRLCKRPPVFLSDYGASESGSCSHSEMIFYKEHGEFRMGIQFTEHLKRNGSKEPAYKEDGRPVYGRYFVTGEQIDAFMAKNPDRFEALSDSLQAYGPAGAQYYATARPPKSGFYLCMDGKSDAKYYERPKAVSLRFGNGKGMQDNVRRVSPVLDYVAETADSRNADSHQLHRVIYTLDKVPGLFRNSPVAPEGVMDQAAVERMTGFKPNKDGAYEDGYLLTAQIAMDKRGIGGRNSIQKRSYNKTAYEDVNGEAPPSSAYLATHFFNGQVSHSVAISPELAAKLQTVSKTAEYEGKTYGAVMAPIYAYSHGKAMNASAERTDFVDSDAPEVRSRAQGHACIECWGKRPPKGMVYTIDVTSGHARAAEDAPDMKEHRKYASVMHKMYEDWKAKKDAQRSGQGQSRGRGVSRGSRSAGDMMRAFDRGELGDGVDEDAFGEDDFDDAGDDFDELPF